MKRLSEKQRAILNFLRGFEEKKGYPPSVREIQQACRISSTSVVDYNLRLLEERGIIRRDREVSRGIDILEKDADRPLVSHVPLMGTIAAGEPIPVPGSDNWAHVPEEVMPVPDSMLRGLEGVYALRVRGTSMIEDLINDGDVVLIQSQENARNGDTVVAWLKDEEEVTLKKYFLEGDKVRLQPANATLVPRYVDQKALMVQGRVIGVLRDTG